MGVVWSGKTEGAASGAFLPAARSQRHAATGDCRRNFPPGDARLLTRLMDHDCVVRQLDRPPVAQDRNQADESNAVNQ